MRWTIVGSRASGLLFDLDWVAYEPHDVARRHPIQVARLDPHPIRVRSEHDDRRWWFRSSESGTMSPKRRARRKSLGDVVSN